jgi:MHS family proline/betaine transporter-like MFS transporter
VGGEYTSSMVFLVEHAPEGRRGLMGALAATGGAIGTLLGSVVGAAFAASMSTAALDAWGWRIPFLLGLVVGFAGYILRRHVLETGVAEKRMRAPIVETLRDHRRVVATFAGLSVFSAVTFYIGFVYMVSWLQTADGIPPSRALEINTFSMVVSLPVLIAAGWLSDRVTQASYAPRKHGRAYRCLAPVLAVEPSLGAVCSAWAARPCIGVGSLLRGFARHSGGGCASNCALHRGGARL